jgi:hypothetical protein
MQSVTSEKLATATTQPQPQSNQQTAKRAITILGGLAVVLFLNGCAPLTHPVSSPKLFNQDRGTIPTGGAMNSQVML